jgi:hypothetical protein
MGEFQFGDGGIPIPPKTGESEFTHPESELLLSVVAGLPIPQYAALVPLVQIRISPIYVSE